MRPDSAPLVVSFDRHPREGGDPATLLRWVLRRSAAYRNENPWIPAFAGMTNTGKPVCLFDRMQQPTASASGFPEATMA